ncbi:MAG: hypothetical protein GT589_02075 [Peptoclostridium sp.]|uniref:hypothetical protein n=1 Tax=Peptoclostridium sp. TaxID=1904860 RepID=UPI00139EF525|nr:hypothetical protein [Peptoclostridium sp.]MZQ74928.1 hypothetical protein [Peptoclostridium sp.]
MRIVMDVDDETGKVTKVAEKYIEDGYEKQKPIERVMMGTIGIDLINQAWAGGNIE